MKTAVFFATHVSTPEAFEHWQALRAGLPSGWTLVLFHEDGRLTSEQLVGFDATHTVAHGPEQWKLVKQPSRFFPHKIPGNGDANFLWGIRQIPRHDFYWLVEYDVALTGSWRRFFEEFEGCEADCVSTNLTRYVEFPRWPLWRSFEGPAAHPIPQERWLRCFAPVLRLSHRAVEAAEEKYREGYAGHAEFILPTVLNEAGLSFEDIGGDSSFTPPERKGRWYRSTRLSEDLAPGTFVFRPPFHASGSEPDQLWHPVKRRSGSDWDLREPEGNGVKRFYWSLHRRLRGIRPSLRKLRRSRQ